MTLDGWYVNPTGATVAWSQTTLSPLSATRCLNGLSLTGNVGITQTSFYQPIEALIAAQLSSQTVTLSFDVYNNTGAAITPTLDAFYPTATDNFASVLFDVTAVNLQSCPNTSWTRCSYTFTANALATRGYGIRVNFGTALNSAVKNIIVTGADLRITPSVTTGLTAVPTVCAWRPYTIDLALAQRYTKILFDKNMAMGIAPTTTSLQAHYVFEQPMRVAPTLSTLVSGTFFISDDFASDFNTTTATIGVTNMSIFGGRVLINGFTGLTVGRVYGSGVNGTALGTNRILADAEL